MDDLRQRMPAINPVPEDYQEPVEVEGQPEEDVQTPEVELPRAVMDAKEKGLKVFALVDQVTDEPYYFRVPSKGLVYRAINASTGKKAAQAMEQLILDCAISPNRSALLEEIEENPMFLQSIMPKFQEECGGDRDFEIKKI